MIINKGFDGKMNLDDHPYRIPTGDYNYALNITRDSTGQGQDKIVANIVGNQQVSYALPAGTNKRIGSKGDLIKNRIYYFVWNSNGNNLILYYDYNTNAIVKLLISKTDTMGIDILNFNPSYRMNHIDIIYRDEGDLLYWTDGLNFPMVINVEDAEANFYNSAWALEYLTVNRPLFPFPPLCAYANDATTNINNLRKKLYQFKYRAVYKDFTKSVWSPVSKLFAPVNPDSIGTDIDPTKNNVINVTINTGNPDCVKIEIAARQSIDTTYSDFFLVTTLDKIALSIPNNSTYQYSFYNDSTYPYIDINESLLLYSNVPNQAYAQALPNGNVVCYAANTEDYDFDETLNVTSAVALISNSGSTSLNYSATYGEWHFESPLPHEYHGFQVLFTGSMALVNTVQINMEYTLAATTYTYSSLYTWNGTDTIQQMVSFFRSDIRAHATGFNAYSNTDNDPDNTIPPNTILITANDILFIGIPTYSVTITSTSPGVNDVDIGAYKHRARYSFVLQYFDDFGVTDGSQYEATSMALLMPELDTTGGTQMSIPQITFNIFHQPPIWATSFSWGRSTNLTFLSSIACVSDSTQKDSSTTYAYLEITSLQNNQNNYSAYEFLDGDRVRIIGLYVEGMAGTVNEYDFPIVALLTNPTINGATVTGDFIKIPYDTVLSNFGTAGFNNYYIEIYTPAPNTNTTQQIFYEFGESYPILNPGQSNRAHGGQQQDQIVGTQPAIYNFVRGDYYIRTRIYLSTLDPTWILDQSVSDLYPSQVQSIGRAFVIESDLKKTYFPTLIRFGGAYQQDTNINQTNLFYPSDYDEYDRSNGDIRKLFIEGKYMYVFHKFEVGVVPILIQIVQDTAGNPLQANTDTLLNKIMYPYKGKYGIGDVPESFAYYNYAKYFVDPNKGVVLRLSQDGMIPISVLYKCNSFFVPLLKNYNTNLNNGNPPMGGVYTGNPTVYGCFDFFTNKYIVALEAINRYDSGGNLIFSQSPYTLVFAETRDQTEGFESFTSYFPEGMEALGTLFVSFNNGNLWTHNSTTYAHFFGAQYDANIQAVFNDSPLQKKTWISVEQASNTIWDCPQISTQLMSYGTTPQQSELLVADFAELEGMYNASFLNDSNSPGGIINGDALKGAYIIVNFRVQNAASFVFLSIVSVKWIDSPLTNK